MESLDASNILMEPSSLQHTEQHAPSGGGDSRLLEAAAAGHTDTVLQLLEEDGQELHSFKDQVQYKTRNPVIRVSARCKQRPPLESAL